MRAALVIPALDEQGTIGAVLREIPAGVFEQIVVADNGSSDATAQEARAAGAQVVHEPRRGYGAACLRGISAVAQGVDVIVFMDADGSDDPAEALELIAPIAAGEADLVIGSRERGEREVGALAAHQRVGNRFATWLIAVLFGTRYTDLGPFRAIRRASLEKLGMSDRGFGWTIEMQIRALRRGLRVREVPVRYRRRRGGRSKISGNLLASISAGAKILWTVARHAFRPAA